MPGQTLSEVRQLLADAGLAPLHRFGQNFLIDLNLMRKVVDAADIHPGDWVLEVGPGTGSLTELLLERGATVVAVEIDHGLQVILRQRLAGNPRFTLISGDALAGKHAVNPEIQAALAASKPAQRKLVANLPYQIATPLLMELLHVDAPMTTFVCTIQKEVAERLRAGPGGSEYGPLSVIAQTLARVEWIATLPPTAFWPAPSVESAAVRITPFSISTRNVANAGDFARFIQTAFAQRRKMLRRLIKELKLANGEHIFAAAGIRPEARPEEVSVPQWQALYAALGPASP